MGLLFVVFYYMKYLLMRNGYKFHLLNHLEVYPSFKKLIENERNPQKKQRYLNTLFMLKSFGVILVVSTVLGVIFI